MSEIIELYSESVSTFKYHIEDEENTRTIFTGRFGAGKTMFLKHFFNKQLETIGTEKYYPIHIFPVNYSISGNEDIIKFIKYDIITHLLLNNTINVSDSIDLKTVSGRFLIKNIDRIIASIFLFIPTWGGDAHKAFEKFKELINEFKEFAKSDADEVADFIERIEGDIKSPFEEDFITKLIQNACTKLKEREKEKEVVVIIDDLDRIDPDHIFRILNVFAAHFDFHCMTTLPNKYGFEKLILVGDIHNIRNIFKAKFGGDTDFNGYIDKFYSKNIYQFDNSQVLKMYWRNIVSKINFYNSNNSDKEYYKSALKSSYNLPIIEKFIELNFITTRQIFKFYNKNFYIVENKNVKLLGRTFPHYFCQTALFLFYLKNLFNTTQDFRERILKTQFTLTQKDTIMEDFCSDLSMIHYLITINPNWVPNGADKITFRTFSNIYEFTLNILLNGYHVESSNYSVIKVGSAIKFKTQELPLGELMLNAVDSLNSINYFES